MFSREMDYYAMLLEIESRCPIGDNKAILDYYKSQIDLLSVRLKGNAFLYQYYTFNEDCDDSLFFVRNPEGCAHVILNDLDFDNHTSNVYSAKFGEMQAIEDLISYLDLEIVNQSKDKNGDSETSKESKSNRVFWKGSLAHFYELVFALVDAQAVTGNIKQVMTVLGHCLDVKPGNYYGYYQAMRIRKKDRTPFLNWLIKCLLKRMDEGDEYPLSKK